MTIVMPKQLSLDETFRVLDAVLSLPRADRLLKEGPLLRIAAAAPQASPTQWPSTGDPPDRRLGPPVLGATPRPGYAPLTEIRVLRILQHADARQVARVINVSSPTGAASRRWRAAPPWRRWPAGRQPIIPTGPDECARARVTIPTLWW